MTKYLLTALLSFTLTTSFGQHFNQKYGQPIIVLIETNPWLMVIGSDVPSFALYENGQIIYRKLVDRKYKYFEIKNDTAKTEQIIKSFGITDSLMKQPDFIEASSWTDQPTNIMILNFDTIRQISVYGSLQYPESDARKKTPASFLSVYDNILKYKDNDAVEWIPDTIEVMATKFSYSREKPLQWNKEWSDINSPTTVKRGDDLYSIYIDKRYFKDLITLIKNMNPKQAVEINGGKYSLTYRLPFPNLR